MKVLFVIESLNTGGAEKVLLDTIKELRKAFDITVLSLYEYRGHKSFVDEVKKLVHFESAIRYYQTGSWTQKGFSRILSRLRRIYWDYISPTSAYKNVIHDVYDLEIAFLEGRATRIVSGSTNKTSIKYAWVHTDMQKNPWSEVCYRRSQEEQLCYKKFTRIFAVSHDVGRAFSEKFLLPATFIQNIIDDEQIRLRAQESGSPYEKKRRPIFVAVGRMVKVKGYERLLIAAAQLKQALYDFELHFVGSGEEEPQLRSLAQKLSLDNVVFHGHQDNPYVYLSNADLYVCSSYTEGLSSTVAESLILAIPVLTTDCAGMRDLLGESQWGLIVENSTQGLYEGLKSFLQEAPLLDFYAARARERGQSFISQNLAKTLIERITEDTAAARVGKMVEPQRGFLTESAENDEA